MWFRTKTPTCTIDQDFITRYWDLQGRVDNLEAQLEDRLHELELRYKRSEQAERRLDEKRQESPCSDESERPNDRAALRTLMSAGSE